MSSVPVSVGDKVTVSKTISESDVYLFAGISGDFSPEHTDKIFISRTRFKTRIAHGALSVALMSAASGKLTTAASERLGHGGPTPVALGFDRVSFLKPVFFGDTLVTTYTVEAIDEEKRRSIARVEVHNQAGDLMAIARHINAWVPPPSRGELRSIAPVHAPQRKQDFSLS
jgi:acyl dehydratase